MNSEKLIKQKNDWIMEMTLEEKASLMSGANFWNTKSIDRLGIPSIMLTDGPHGLRKQGGKADHLGLNKSLPATCFPTAATLANSWDEELLNEVGEYLGKEAAAENVSVLLGPGLNLKRNPLCGRNFEYFSEDPFLSGKMAGAMIRGIQSQGVSACAKHFAVNSQERNRMQVDEIVDERALRELYLEGFRIAVNEGHPKSIMTSYNKVNGTYANENTHLLLDILREEWGYQGFVVTDWGGNNDRVAGLKAGNALEMPSTDGITDDEIVQAVKNGQLKEEVLDERVSELLQLVQETGHVTGDPVQVENHHEMAVRAARKSMVLLKNEDEILPLKVKGNRVAVIGDFADNPRYQGAGSSLIEPTKLVDFLSVFKNSQYDFIGYEKGYDRLGGTDENLLSKAVQLAEKADTLLLFMGLDEGSEAEGVDRVHMRLAMNQNRLVKALSKVSKSIIVVLAGGSPIECPFYDQVKGILHGYLPGQGGGQAIYDVLSGDYNPSGKLAETYPVKYEDVPSASYYPGMELTSEHRESIYIGYRYYDKRGMKVRFPFGFGLSYTSFRYLDMTIEDNTVSVSIENTGALYGEEIIQVYVEPLDRKVFHAPRELKAFAKVGLNPGEIKKVLMTISDHGFAYYNDATMEWRVESGRYKIGVGSSSRDIKLWETVNLGGQEKKADGQGIPSAYEEGLVHNVSSEDFEMLLGRPLPDAKWAKSKVLGKGDVLDQMKYGSFLARGLHRFIHLVNRFLKWRKRPIAANNVLFVLALPIRSLSRMSGGRIDMKMLDSIIDILNGKVLVGSGSLIKATIKKLFK